MTKRFRPSFMFLLAAVLTVTAAIAGEGAPAAKPQDQPAPRATANTPDKGAPGRVVRVYYFHGHARCATCMKIEALSAAAVSSGFPREVKEGTIVWDVIDTDDAENRHFVNDYQLYTKSVIVAEIVDGKQVQWKNLSKIWQLVHDDAAFTRYIQDEIREYLKERS